MESALAWMIECFEKGGKLLICGNGGSASDADHIVGELMKGFRARRRVTDERIPTDLRELLQGALPAISLSSQDALITAFANDVAPEMIFAQQVYGYGREKDVLLAVSTSGNSVNVLNAAKVAKALGIRVIGLTGAEGGRLASEADVSIKVPETETYKVQEYHLPVYHYLCMTVERHFFTE
jgi:D-sedoheptulose 7-phosphate isomerase